MKSYVVESTDKPLMVMYSSGRETMENFVKKFPERLQISYREINSKQAKKIDELVVKELAEILTDKYLFHNI